MLKKLSRRKIFFIIVTLLCQIIVAIAMHKMSNQETVWVVTIVGIVYVCYSLSQYCWLPLLEKGWFYFVLISFASSTLTAACILRLGPEEWKIYVAIFFLFGYFYVDSSMDIWICELKESILKTADKMSWGGRSLGDIIREGALSPNDEYPLGYDRESAFFAMALLTEWKSSQLCYGLRYGDNGHCYADCWWAEVTLPFLGYVVVDLARPREVIIKKRKIPFRSAAKWDIARRDKVIPYSVFWQNEVVKDLLDELRGEKGVEMLCGSAPPIDALAQAFDEYIEDLL